MRVLHLESPRDLSFSLKPWRLDLHEAVAEKGFYSRQVDLNHLFWPWVLGQSGLSLYSRLLDLEFGSGQSHHKLVAELGKVLGDTTVPNGLLHSGGLQFSRDILQDSAILARWVDSECRHPFFDRWWQTLPDTVGDFANWDMVTFGIGSLEELAVAALLSERIRQERPETHTCLAFHQWENVSLVDRIPRLSRDGALLDLFDSIVLHQEDVGTTMAGLLDALAHGSLEGLHNLAITIDGTARVIPAQGGKGIDGRLSTGEGLSDYVESTGLPAGQILYLESVVRNSCYYGKCSFCVQNEGYRQRQFYKQDPEVKRIMEIVRHLVTVDGVRHFSFVDQAVPPSLFGRLAKEIKAAGLDVNWCLRMLATELEDPVLAEAAESGCREILFGIESASPSSLESIDKRTAVSGPGGLHYLVDRLAVHGIDATYSFIRGLPCESPDEYAASTLAFIAAAEGHQNLTIILNRFALFSGSQMEQDPARYGIREVIRSGADLELELDYHADYWPAELRAIPTHEALMATGLASDTPPERVQEAVRLHYSSIGLLHRWRTGRWLISEIREGCGDPPLPLYADREQVILGASGYLGHNLAKRMPEDQVVLSATNRAHARSMRAAPWLEQDLCHGPGILFRLAPVTAWIAARPVGGPFAERAAFYTSLQMLIHSWLQRGSLQRVVFFSSQLVMQTPGEDELASGQWPTEPECEYGCHLAQMEVFLSTMARKQSLSVDVIRLPLLWGGAMLERHREGQVLSNWHRQLVAGRRWEILTDKERFYGNSWVDVGDLIDALQEDRGPGVRIQTAKSGDFRYSELQQNLGPATDPEPLHLHRTCFFLKDELGLPQRALDLQESPVPRDGKEVQAKFASESSCS